MSYNFLNTYRAVSEHRTVNRPQIFYFVLSLGSIFATNFA